MARGKKTDESLKEKIRAYYALSGNINETAKEHGVSWSTVRSILEENPDEFEKLREHKKTEMIDNVWSDMSKALELGRQKINLATVALNEFKPTLDRLIELLEEKDDVKSKDIIDLIKALSSITNIPLSHISTYFGTLYDKRALMTGESTNNIKHSGEMTQNVNHDLSKYSVEELKQLEQILSKNTESN